MLTRKYSIAFISFIFLFHIILVTAAGAVNTIMPLGDSITQGNASGVLNEEFQISYRKALYDRLKAAGYVINDEIFVGTLFSGESVADFDPDHDGHPGWQALQIVNGNMNEPLAGKLDQWLIAEKPNIVLLHIGTNDITVGNQDWNDVEAILVVIDNYEAISGKDVWVVLALIIDRACSQDTPACPESAQTTAFNNAVRINVFNNRQSMGDKIVLVDMQNDALINYNLGAGGDMFNNLHPLNSGYEKMADLWFTGLLQILPQADAGTDQSVNLDASVTLDGSGSTINPKNGTLSFQWTQTAGPNVALSGSTSPQATFDAPNAGPVTLTFTLTVTDDDELVSTDTVTITVNNPPTPAPSGGGGGGGGCFITSAANGSPLALPGKVQHEPHSQFTMVNWKRLTPFAAHTATLALVVTMVVFISACAAITLRRSRKKSLKLYHHDRLKMSIFSKKGIGAYLHALARSAIQSYKNILIWHINCIYNAHNVLRRECESGVGFSRTKTPRM